MKDKKVIITKVVKIGVFIHIEALTDNEEKAVYIYSDRIKKLNALEKLLLSEARKDRPELFI
jgi:hypothetical protein